MNVTDWTGARVINLATAVAGVVLWVVALAALGSSAPARTRSPKQSRRANPRPLATGQRESICVEHRRVGTVFLHLPMLPPLRAPSTEQNPHCSAAKPVVTD